MTEFFWIGTSNPMFEELTGLRRTIFHREFGMPENFGSGDDKGCLHLLVRQDGQPAGCARLCQPMQGVMMANMVAVAAPFRGQGIGTAMVQELHRKCRQLGAACLRLIAELDTTRFFQRQGLMSTGAECDIADYTVEIMVAEYDENPYEVNWLAPGADISAALELRRQVFGQEFGYTNDPDELDPAAHTLLMQQDGQTVACGRVAVLPDGSLKLGKIALAPQLRGSGMGRALMENLEFKAVELGAGEVFLSARNPALDFYRHMGYAPYGDSFMEGPEPHTNVRKTL